MAARASVEGRPVWLLEPTTFMNLSGKSVAALARFFKIEPGEILVVHDELDLLPGQVKLKLGGSHAGHNGLKDIHAQLGSADYWRLRIGIGHPGVKAEVINYVLKKPSPEHRIEIEKAIEQSISGLDLILAGDMERATMKINARPPRPKPQARSQGPAATQSATRHEEPQEPVMKLLPLLAFAAAGAALLAAERRDDLSLRPRILERRLRRWQDARRRQRRQRRAARRRRARSCSARRRSPPRWRATGAPRRPR